VPVLPGSDARRALQVDELGTNKRAGLSNAHGACVAGNSLDMTTIRPFLPYPAGEDEYRVAAADPGGEGAPAPAPAPGFGEAEGEPDIIDDTPEPGAVDPIPERPAAEIPFAPLTPTRSDSTARAKAPQMNDLHRGLGELRGQTRSPGVLECFSDNSVAQANITVVGAASDLADHRYQLVVVSVPLLV